MKRIIRRLFNLLGYELSKLGSYNELKKLQIFSQIERMEIESCLKKVCFVISNSTTNHSNKLNIEGFLNFSADKVHISKSQIFQDLFVLYFFNEKKNGFFVDFGATNGICLSNTYLLEKDYNWKGILAEPCKIWQSDLRKNRTSIIESHCIWSKTGSTLTFNETMIAELSQLDLNSDKDFMSSKRNIRSTYEVFTISLNDLLETHKAPYDIDYLSIDTEGSEFEILQAFNFDKHSIKIITVEHNFTAAREQIFELLTCKGYKRVFEKISLFDDWYIKEIA